MQIECLVLRNFRAFRQLEVQFHPRLSVVVGKNGSGKTSVLEALAISAGTLFYAMPGPAKCGIRKTDVHERCFDIGSGIDVQAQYPVAVGAWGRVEGKHIRWFRSLEHENGRTTVAYAKDMTRLSSHYQQRLMEGDESLLLPIVAYYGTGRLWDHRREKKRESLRKNTRTNGYIDSLDGTANVKLMLQWFQKMSFMEEQRAAPAPQYLAVRRAMECCLARFINRDDVAVQYNPDSQEIEVLYSEQNGERVRMALSRMSDGYRCALSLIADIAYRMATLNPQLMDEVLTRTEGVVLIDEVDLHLHPAWQQRFLGDLTDIFPKVQFIVTTHAPAVINSVQSENLVILENGETREPQGEVYGKDVNTIIEGVMSADKRPVEVLNLFQKFYALIDQHRGAEAEKAIREIEAKIGTEDSELAACRVKLKLEQFRGVNHD